MWDRDCLTLYVGINSFNLLTLYSEIERKKKKITSA